MNLGAGLDSQLLAAAEQGQRLGARAGAHAQAAINEHGHQLAVDNDGNGKHQSMQERCDQGTEEEQIVNATRIAKELVIVDGFHLGLFGFDLLRFRLASVVRVAILHAGLCH